MDLIIFVLLILLGFAGMEIISYLAHRFLFHGILWNIHQTHHRPDHGIFEMNDIFSFFFAALSIGLIYWGADQPLKSTAFPIGLGITIYGLLYFIIHDLFTHKRFVPFRSDSKIMKFIRRAHQNHHQSADKQGREPYGLFLFPYSKYSDRKTK